MKLLSSFERHKRGDLLPLKIDQNDSLMIFVIIVDSHLEVQRSHTQKGISVVQKHLRGYSTDCRLKANRNDARIRNIT